jgi:hypothetical protein
MSKPGAAQFPTTFRAAPSRVATKTEAQDVDQDHKKYGREKLAFASDTTDAEWSVIERLLPLPNKRGRPRTTPCERL